jgi:hypothetical protein
LAQARQSFPQISFARNRYVDTLQTEHTAASPGAAGRQYAHGLVGATAVQRLPQPVRIGVIDGAPDPNVPLDAASFDLQRFTDAGQSPHASAISCELACRPETGFPGLARGAELVWAAILSPHPNGHERSDLVTLARALDGLVKRRAEVILTSLGTPPNPVLTRVLDRVLPKVRAFVAAAGNGGPNGTVPLPAAHPGVIAVAAVDAAAQPWPQGSRGQAILVAAPGVDLWLPVGGAGISPALHTPRRSPQPGSHSGSHAASPPMRLPCAPRPRTCRPLGVTTRQAAGCCVGRPSESAIEEKRRKCRLSNIPSTKGAQHDCLPSCDRNPHPRCDPGRRARC